MTKKPSKAVSSSKKKAAPGKKVVAKRTVAAAAAKSKKASQAVRQRKVKAAKKPSGKAVAKRSDNAKVTTATASDRKKLREMLLALRQRLDYQIAVLKDESLTRDDSSNSEEDGTDAFDRQFALGLATNDREKIIFIDEAIARIDNGTYGVCDDCGEKIDVSRLKALPFVKNCIKCQSEKERSSGRPHRVMVPF
ncbi:MAG: hypothetical protein FJ224_08460 [Lentisphaerae bacterium]|nr:hypothetical protein [Lentisphaerota bacterium]